MDVDMEDIATVPDTVNVTTGSDTVTAAGGHEDDSGNQKPLIATSRKSAKSRLGQTKRDADNLISSETKGKNNSIDGDKKRMKRAKIL